MAAEDEKLQVEEAVDTMTTMTIIVHHIESIMTIVDGNVMTMMIAIIDQNVPISRMLNSVIAETLKESLRD